MIILGNILLLIACILKSTASTVHQQHLKSHDTESHGQKGICQPLILTPYLKTGKIAEAQSLATVHLAQFPAINSYSGYFTVNKTCNSNMFFWFFPTERKNITDPLIVWLQGGPGGSSLYGLVNEIGPFYIHNNTEMKRRKYHWSDKRNLLFIDNPVGTGFSFTKNSSECYAHNQDDIRNNLYEFLLQFYTLFPDLQKNDLFLFGESYAGKYIPGLAYSIYKNNNASKIKINLQGLGIGDGFTDPVSMLNYSSLLFNAGMVNENGRKQLQPLEEKTIENIKRSNWTAANYAFEKLFDKIQQLTGNISYYNYLRNANFNPDIPFFNREDIKCIIHTGGIDYGKTNDLVRKYLSEDFLKSVKPWVEELLEHIDIMFYNGQVDVLVGAVLTQNFISTLKWSGAKMYYREPQTMLQDFTIAWKTQSVRFSLSQYRIRNAGHMVPEDQPEYMYKVLEYFLENRHF